MVAMLKGRGASNLILLKSLSNVGLALVGMSLYECLADSRGSDFCAIGSLLKKIH